MESLVNIEMDYFVLRHCDLDWRLEHKVFPMYDMVLVLEGTSHYIIDGMSYDATAGNVILVRPGSTREATTTGMDCAAFDFILRRGSLSLPVVFSFYRNQELDRLLKEFEYEWLQRNEGYLLKCNALFLLILHEILYRDVVKPTNHHVEMIKRYIVENFNRSLSIGEIASVVGLSTVYCGALFKKVQGMSIAEYANRIKVQKAADFLETGGYDITRVAYLCGFSDVYYFSHTFKKYMSISPNAYRFNPKRVTRELMEHQLQLLQD